MAYWEGEAGGRSGSASGRAERADIKPWSAANRLPGNLTGVHDVLQVPKYRVGEPVTAPLVPNPLDRVELGAVRRQRQQGDVAGHHEPLGPVPAGSVEDHQGIGIGGNLAADLVQVVVYRRRVAGRIDPCCRLARRGTARAKQMGRGEAEVPANSKLSRLFTVGNRASLMRPSTSVPGRSVRARPAAADNEGGRRLRQRIAGGDCRIRAGSSAA